MKKLLVIDDDIDHREIMADNLHELGVDDISFAGSGSEGIVMARSEHPDLVIIDVVLPDMDGYEVCSEIKKIPENHTKVVLMTAFVDAVDALRAKKVGADDFCAKTGDLFPMDEAIKQFLV